MSDKDSQPSRRTILQATTGALASAGIVGLSSAKPADKVEVNVGFDGPSGRNATLSAADDVVREFNFDAATIQLPKKGAEALARNPNIRYVEENGTMHALAETEGWGIDRVDADVAHANGETGSGADIAILDTGIDSDHPDLQANIGSGKSFVSCSTKGGCRFGAKPADNTCYQSWDDDNNHGTHCAGIANAVDNTEGVIGVSTEATLHAVKVLDKCGSGSFSDIAAGVEYVADQGWDVGSMSLGASSGSSALRDACQYAVNAGVLLVGAAGNSGPCTDCVGYPAAYPEVMAVSSTASDDTLSDFSSTGPEVEIAAPGTDIYSSVASNGGYDTYSGTSMATPHVAGAAGLLMANGYTASEARDQLTSTAEDIGLSSNESGAGLLDAAASLGLDSSDN
ncbi:S8 family peptidase [Haloarchaeobius sp. HME9146]|uniref:S8 family peptidase n=1 Tax=Haloarchaeobius sp. HME9146 TaxID=2978732 RepID=UPI0021BF4B83|nr:S8 family peptidase [Haloarchaeobius sp. HME9146]MCT9096457.1 S8 family peptidase [Haloarchaeobius sp. HME9146]